MNVYKGIGSEYFAESMIRNREIEQGIPDAKEAIKDIERAMESQDTETALTYIESALEELNSFKEKQERLDKEHYAREMQNLITQSYKW